MRQPRFAESDQVPPLADTLDVLGARAVDRATAIPPTAAHGAFTAFEVLAGMAAAYRYG